MKINLILSLSHLPRAETSAALSDNCSCLKLSSLCHVLLTCFCSLCKPESDIQPNISDLHSSYLLEQTPPAGQSIDPADQHFVGGTLTTREQLTADTLLGRQL